MVTRWGADHHGGWRSEDNGNGNSPGAPVVWKDGPNAIPPVGGYNALASSVSLEAYGSEVRWNVSNANVVCIDGATGAPSVLGPGFHLGRIYRVQFLIHDGDQNKNGGDAGQSCAIMALPQ